MSGATERMFVSESHRPQVTVRPNLPPTEPTWQVQVFYDGDCPLCVREIKMLRKMDRRQRIEFTDIAAADFDPASFGNTMENLMAEIHGRLPDGTWIQGVEVFPTALLGGGVPTRCQSHPTTDPLAGA